MVEKYNNWIFDWSGTIVDDLALVVDATNHVMRTYQKPEFDRESFKSSFSLPYREWYQEVLPKVDIDEIEEHFRHGFEISESSVPVLSYAREFLELLSNQGKKLFVCTSMGSKDFIQQAEDHGLMQYFEKTYSGVLDKRELIKEIISTHNLERDETIFVGDMIHDIDTAHHGGISSLAVLTGYNSREELEGVEPTYLLPNYSRLLS